MRLRPIILSLLLFACAPDGLDTYQVRGQTAAPAQAAELELAGGLGDAPTLADIEAGLARLDQLGGELDRQAQEAAEAATRTKARTATARTAPVTVTVEVRPGPCAGWEGLIASYFPAEQVGKGCRVMMCESKGNPTADNPSPTSTASGLFQFLDSTWDGLDGRPPKGPAGYAGVARALYAPPETQIAAAHLLWSDAGWGPWSCA